MFVWVVAERMLQLENEGPVTRRKIVSAVYSLFNPLGFIAPFVMKAKLILQMLCRKGLGWDDHIQANELSQWKRWVVDLPKLQEIRVRRCFKPAGFIEVKDVSLHIFSDASRLGYSAVAYLRLKNGNNEIHCSFVIGKARLAPLREISIPRLELTAAVISVRLSKIIREELDMVVQRVCYWTDSMSVLKCINNESKRFHTFESNRLSVIRSGSHPSEWNYVNRDDNPADEGSKGVRLDVLRNKGQWLKGPAFLWEDESHWPKGITIPELMDEDREVRKEAQIYVTAEQPHLLDMLISRHSVWWKLRCSVAWLLRYKDYLLSKARQRKVISGPHLESEFKVGRLTMEELDAADREIFAHVQNTTFSQELKLFAVPGNGKEFDKALLRKSGISIRQLNPMMVNGLLKVGGRLGNAPINGKSKHPIILPFKHPVTDMIIRQHHAEVGHMGQESVLSSLRKEFWIIKGRTAVRRVVRSCLACQRRKARLGEQLMSDLPKSRVTPQKPPFTIVGIDYFGPMLVKRGRSLVKGYGCLFTCFTTRAIHIEIAHSLDTDSMINALRRFISMRILLVLTRN
ncbi:uncharacterized protein LOC124435902 [Xenia sp. Carnegie-2017]|uniref:uncharacterized protein LOC124435902 n=1 Tax=Xenia sp. Carnegie-2017 TaxID=2897299 RepID=UPI001F04D911|nr:uncharacterized protein LOC124435902 [Xenia sp. Carnegie-2017]